jgi:hypothetical protein
MVVVKLPQFLWGTVKYNIVSNNKSGRYEGRPEKNQSVIDLNHETNPNEKTAVHPVNEYL